MSVNYIYFKSYTSLGVTKTKTNNKPVPITRKYKTNSVYAEEKYKDTKTEKEYWVRYSSVSEKNKILHAIANSTTDSGASSFKNLEYVPNSGRTATYTSVTFDKKRKATLYQYGTSSSRFPK